MALSHHNFHIPYGNNSMTRCLYNPRFESILCEGIHTPHITGVQNRIEAP